MKKEFKYYVKYKVNKKTKREFFKERQQALNFVSSIKKKNKTGSDRFIYENVKIYVIV